MQSKLKNDIFNFLEKTLKEKELSFEDKESLFTDFILNLKGISEDDKKGLLLYFEISKFETKNKGNRNKEIEDLNLGRVFNCLFSIYKELVNRVDIEYEDPQPTEAEDSSVKEEKKDPYLFSKAQMVRIGGIMYERFKQFEKKENDLVSEARLSNFVYELIHELRTKKLNIMMGSDDIEKLHEQMNQTIKSHRKKIINKDIDSSGIGVHIGILGVYYSDIYDTFENLVYKSLREKESS